MPTKKQISDLRKNFGRVLENLSRKRVRKFEIIAARRLRHAKLLERSHKALGEELKPKTKVDSAFEFAELAGVKARRIRKRHETGWIGRAIKRIKSEA